jgi:protein phosphatase
LKTFGLSDIGRVRAKNEDRYLIKELANGTVLLAVADGMGGEAAGEHAAEIVLDIVSRIEIDPGKEERLLRRLVMEADQALVKEGQIDPAVEGMGTTITAALVSRETAHWVHVGDSRLSILRAHELIGITRDQNMARWMVDQGELSEEEASHHPLRHLLEQCVGHGHAEPETGLLEIKANDILLLATDGLFGEVTADRIASILAAETQIEDKGKSLIQAALKAGGRDNITVVVAQI